MKWLEAPGISAHAPRCLRPRGLGKSSSGMVTKPADHGGRIDGPADSERCRHQYCALLGISERMRKRVQCAMAALKQLAVPLVKVRRDGRPLAIPAQDVVPGDVILLDAGGIAAADARLLSSPNLRVQEASLAGESQPVEKDAEASIPPGAWLSRASSVGWERLLGAELMCSMPCSGRAFIQSSGSTGFRRLKKKTETPPDEACGQAQ